MRHSKSKKTFLTVGTGSLTTASALLVQGSYVEGGLLALIGAALIVGYDVLDDRAKGPKPVLPAGVDAETMEEIAESGADLIEDVTGEESSES